MLGETRYLAYLLRLWVTSHGENAICRAILLDPHSGEQRGFADLESLFRALREVVEQSTMTETVGGTVTHSRPCAAGKEGHT